MFYSTPNLYRYSGQQAPLSVLDISKYISEIKCIKALFFNPYTRFQFLQMTMNGTGASLVALVTCLPLSIAYCCLCGNLAF